MSRKNWGYICILFKGSCLVVVLRCPVDVTSEKRGKELARVLLVEPSSGESKYWCSGELFCANAKTVLCALDSENPVVSRGVLCRLCLGGGSKNKLEFISC